MAWGYTPGIGWETVGACLALWGRGALIGHPIRRGLCCPVTVFDFDEWGWYGLIGQGFKMAEKQSVPGCLNFEKKKPFFFKIHKFSKRVNNKTSGIIKHTHSHISWLTFTSMSLAITLKNFEFVKKSGRTSFNCWTDLKSAILDSGLLLYPPGGFKT